MSRALNATRKSLEVEEEEEILEEEEEEDTEGIVFGKEAAVEFLRQALIIKVRFIRFFVYDYKRAGAWPCTFILEGLFSRCLTISTYRELLESSKALKP